MLDQAVCLETQINDLFFYYFEVFRGPDLDGTEANLTEQFCLRGSLAHVVKGDPDPVVLKLALPSFTTVEQLKAAARDYQMQFLGYNSQGKVF